MAVRDTLPLATLETCFRLLCTDPGALMIDGQLLPDALPCRPIRLDELRGRIDRLPQEARYAVLAGLVARAQGGSPAWRVGLAGLLLPSLRELAQRQGPSDRATAEADVLDWLRGTLALPAPKTVRSLQWLLQVAADSGSASTTGDRCRQRVSRLHARRAS